MSITRHFIMNAAVLVAAMVPGGVAGQPAPANAVHASAQMVGINVILNQAPSQTVLDGLGNYGIVLDVIPEIDAVTLRGQAADLPAIRALPYVAAANRDAERYKAAMRTISGPDLSDGANQWSLDAINVTEFGGGRTVAYDGEGVYVAVIDDGLLQFWRSYFPEERIDTVHARSFAGGGGDHGTVSSQPNLWEHCSRDGHGTAVASIILGFRYFGPEQLPSTFNGVAPKATVIPINVFDNREFYWSSVIAHAITYVGNLKASGALGGAPVVINLSNGGDAPDALERAAIDYAIANGVVVVAAAGNEADSGMRWPGQYQEVISAAASGWVGAFPPDDPSGIGWILRDVSGGDVSQHFIAPFSAWELPGQDLDVAAPGWAVPAPWAEQNGQVDYSFFSGTSAATPHVVGVAALMLQKNPHLTAGQVEAILEQSAMSLPPGCRDFVFTGIGPGNPPTWGDHSNVFFFNASSCWDANSTGHGLLQADYALAATPLP